MESSADPDGHTGSFGQNYGGGCATRRGMERAMETKRRWAGCTHGANWILSIAAIVASNPGDFGQGRVRCANTGASRSDLIEKARYRDMPVAQVACSLAEQNVRVNSQEWRGMALSS